MHDNLPAAVIDGFWAYVDKDGDCWLWFGAGDLHNGYGMYRGRSVHRFAYELAYGAIPAGLFVRHTCDVPRCVNLAHLCLGTHQENVQDRTQRGRHGALTGGKPWYERPNTPQAVVRRWHELQAAQRVRYYLRGHKKSLAEKSTAFLLRAEGFALDRSDTRTAQLLRDLNEHYGIDLVDEPAAMDRLDELLTTINVCRKLLATHAHPAHLANLQEIEAHIRRMLAGLD